MRYSVKHNASEIKGEIEEFMKTSNFIKKILGIRAASAGGRITTAVAGAVALVSSSRAIADVTIK